MAATKPSAKSHERPATSYEPAATSHGPLILDSFLCFDAFFVGVLYLSHFGDGVG
jgi:hypothetical protein